MRNIVGMSFVHLHVHSQYSILDACPSIEDLALAAVNDSMPALALTDHGNLYGAIDFYKACKDAKIKPLIGCELYIAPHSRFDKKQSPGNKNAYHLTLIAKNRLGYHNLMKLSSIGFLEGFYYHPRIDLDALKQYKNGLICLSGCMSSMISQEALNGSQESLREKVLFFHSLFGEDFYLELQRHEMSQEDLEKDQMYQESWLLQQYQDYISKQKKINEKLLDLSKTTKIPVVATNDTHYIHREDWLSHEILLNIQSGEPREIYEKDRMGLPTFRKPNPKRRTYSSHECYFKSSSQMRALFQDIPEAIHSTLEIAKKCELEIDFKTKHYPVYIPPSLHNRTYSKEEHAKAVEGYLWELSEKGIPSRYTPERLEKVRENYPDRDPNDVVRKRLEYEMSIIVPKGMADYLLIVWDFIHWAKTQGIPMGPGRGSGAGSIVCYLTGITDIEPLRFHLFFERFINPERISYPDIDVDICMDRRSDVINYTLQKYGKDNVAQIITFGTMKAKMTIKDVGRVLNVPLSKVNAIAKLVPDELTITLEKALEKDADLKNMVEKDEDARRIIEIGKKLEGSIRNTGIHAAGIIISHEPLTDYIPLCNAKDSEMAATQYSMKPVEMVGMLKVDFLGLKTLTSIQMCVNAIKECTGKEIDWINLPLDNSQAFEVFNQGKTLGIFQLESGGMQELAKNLHLDKFEELIAVGALYRPGPMDMIPSYINRKHGREEIENDHPWMRDILKETYGIIVYQEQVMQIASKLANYSLGEGDVLRRAMGKKDMEQMANEREKFREGAMKNGIDEKTSMLIFDKMEKFAAYGFNKSHAAAYAYLSYVTAYLKGNYPKEWLASLMTCDRDDLTKVAKFIGECHSMDIQVLAPDVNESSDVFKGSSEGVRFAITAIKGIGEGVVEAILQERKSRGPFISLKSFIQRIDTKKVGKKAIEYLILAGAFDFTGWTRDALKASVDPLYERASLAQKEASMGVLNFFTHLKTSSESEFESPPQNYPRMSKQEMLQKEKELLGFYLTGHPLDDYQEFLKRLSCVPLNQVDEVQDGAIFRSAFILDSVEIKVSNRSQRKFAIAQISDGFERFELPIWPELFEEKQLVIRDNQLVYAILQVERKEEGIKLQCKWLESLKEVDEKMVKESDEVYDRLKAQTNRSANFKKREKKEEKEEKKEKMSEANDKLTVTLDADEINLSHILEIKALFEKHRGNKKVEMQFVGKGRGFATLHIEGSLCVEMESELKRSLSQITGVKAVEVLSS